MSEQYDSTDDTVRHIGRVRELLGEVLRNLEERARQHDASKLVEPEKSVFDQMTQKLHGMTYGSQEYWACMNKMTPALQHHYQANRHHPEHGSPNVCCTCFTEWPAGAKECPQCGDADKEPLAPTLTNMTLLDIIEMLADWKAATERHDDGDIRRSLAINTRRFCIPPAINRLMDLTIEELAWYGPKKGS